jgi:hypothetical protein
MNSGKNWSELINAQPMFDVLALANKREQLGHYVARMEIGDTPGFKNNAVNKILLKTSQEPHRYSPSKGEPFLIDVLFETQWGQFTKTEYDISIAPANFSSWYWQTIRTSFQTLKTVFFITCGHFEFE